MNEDERKGYNLAIRTVRASLSDLIADDRVPRHSKPLLSTIRETYKDFYITKEDLLRVQQTAAKPDEAPTDA